MNKETGEAMKNEAGAEMDTKQPIARTCHYCEQPKCRCEYRFGRKGSSSHRMSNVSRQTTVGEMREAFNKYFTRDDSTPAVWSISYTVIDPDKPTKPKSKKVGASHVA